MPSQYKAGDVSLVTNAGSEQGVNKGVIAYERAHNTNDKVRKYQDGMMRRDRRVDTCCIMSTFVQHVNFWVPPILYT